MAALDVRHLYMNVNLKNVLHVFLPAACRGKPSNRRLHEEPLLPQCLCCAQKGHRGW